MDDQSKCLPGPLSGPPVMLETLLRVEDVGKEFPMNDGGTFAALRGFSFTISNIEGKPQIVGLLGPSGAGKTTALRIIAALDRPTSGQVKISDGAAGKLRPVRLGDVGVVFQRYPLFEDLKVMDNLIAPAVRSGIPAKEAKEKALSFLDEFDLVRQGLAWPLQLSGGQRQRVAILQQLMLDRHFIILDEPFSGLDPVNVANVINLISRVANQHTLNTFIIITHDVTSALAISDHVYLMGRERDEKGEPVPGSRVIKEYDLIAEGLAYRPDIEDLQRFAELRKEIRLIEFPRL
jgi:polar amino acid transport system ATP-binding protein/sulfate transport system ATP-binding protein